MTPDVLIPRPDSETLIEAAVAWFADRAPPAQILDLGTGSGALLLVARYGYGIDISLWSVQTLRALPVIVLGGVMLLCLGTLLASRTASIKETELLCHLIHYPALFFGNLTIPLNDAPAWIKSILSVIPINQFVSVLRQVMLDGASLPSL